MNKLITSLALSFLISTLSVPTEAQQSKKVPRIGLLSGFRPSPMPATIEAFRRGLRELGYVEGQTLLIDYRWAEAKDERYAPLAADLVACNRWEAFRRP